MIAASDPQEFVPCGRQQVQRHPGEVILPSVQPQFHGESFLNRFSHFGITESAPKEWWVLKASPSGEEDCEDELYVCGKTTVWSRGAATDNTALIGGGGCIVLKCYTTESPVHHALWSTFCSHRTEYDDPSAETFKVDPVPCLCIVDSTNINIYSQEGEDFISPLPFQVEKVWPTKYGLLIERTLSGAGGDRSSCLPTLFSLLNPLHEISPVLAKQGEKGNLSYMSSPSQKIVFTNEGDPCICMIYDSKTGIHSVWKIRKALLEECKAMCGCCSDTYGHSTSSFNQTAYSFGSPSNQSGFSSSAVGHETIFSTSGDQGHIPSITCDSFVSATSNVTQGLCSPNTSVQNMTFGNRVTTPYLQQRLSSCRSHLSSSPLHRSFSPHNFMSSTSVVVFFDSRDGSDDHEQESGLQPTSSPQMSGLLRRSGRHGYSFPGVHTSSPLSAVSPLGSSGRASVSIVPPSDSRLWNLPPPDAFSNDVDSRPLIPELCLEHVWSENHGMPRENVHGATKVFLSTDFVGQHFLYYLVSMESLLHCVRILETSTSELIFGSVTIIVAKDACSLPILNMTATVDLSGGVVLYSGITMVGKVQIGGVPSSMSNSSYLSLSQFSSSPFPRNFERQESMLASSRPGSALEMYFDDKFLASSPVNATPKSTALKIFGLKSYSKKPLSKYFPGDDILDKQNSTKLTSDKIMKLRDPVGSRVTLEYTHGPLFRITLPEMCSSTLVTDCLNILKQVLQRDVAMQLTIKWYCVRNAPGSQDFSPKVEWEMFIGVLLGLIGYNVEKLHFINRNDSESSTSPANLPKKPKTLEFGSTEDWVYILKYCQRNNLRPWLKSMGFDYSSMENASGEHMSSSSEKCEKIDGESSPGQINTSAVLFPYIPLILFSLHLLYEELKLNTLRWENLPMLAQLLHQLAADLLQEKYVDHYWRDFPGHCPLQREESQLSVDDLMKLSNPGLIPSEPPNVFHRLCLIYRKKTVDPYPCMSQVNSKTKDIIKLSALLSYGPSNPNICPDSFINLIVPPGGRAEQPISDSKTSLQNFEVPYQYRAVLFMAEKGFTEDNMILLPSGVALPLQEAILHCRRDPPLNWPSSAYKLIMRKDMAMQFQPHCAVNSKHSSQTVSKVIGPNGDSRGSESGVVTGDGGGSAVSNGVMSAQGPECRKLSHSLDGTEDGMEGMDMEVLRLRFSKDHRVAEARRLLQSSQPVRIAIRQRPDVSDHEFIEEQERHLYALCTRTMALPVGRGMFTLRTASPVITEPLPIPRLCLTGRAPPRGATIDLSHIETAPNMNLWPLFHNGVAAGLSILPEASGIESAWIVYNKPRGNSDIEHAGFLMALGLNGHLSNLAVLNTYEYLSKVHEMTSVGILLGIAATKRGTMDMAMTKMLSVHVEALLPPTSIELDLPQNVQVAALIGIGLIYQGTAHRHIAEVLLSEIGRPPGPEMDNCFDRESFSLAAGLALGNVVLGLGSCESDDNRSLQSGGLADLHIPDMLHYYMVGGHRRPLTGAQKEKYKTPSYQIREGDSVNIDVTSPGATLALGMMYFNSGNRAVADWMKAPDTQYLLDFVRPDFLILRTVARGLILWNEVHPTCNWIEAQIPESVRPYCLRKPSPQEEAEIDYETMNQVYCNIIAGACMAVGLRYAGSANEEAFRTLHSYAKMFTSLTIKSISELVGKSTIETCLNVIVLSLAMVMAGTGNLDVMRLCRHLRSRVSLSSGTSGAAGAVGAGGASAGAPGGTPGGTNNNSVVTYGSHLATHMALGLLFLGGGRYTLSTSPPAIAALLCAFFPKFPTHSNDNRYHLQALRHLYVLAVEPRLLLPRDIHSGKPCYAHLTLVFLDSSPYCPRSITNLKAPCLLPELNLLKEVRVDDDRYWTIIFDRDRNWDQLKNTMNNMQGLFVQQKAGCLSYTEDPFGFQSLLAQTLTSNTANCWFVPAESIFAFTSDSSIVTFVQYFLRQGRQFFFRGLNVGGCYDNQSTVPLNVQREEEELKLMQFMTSIVYEQVTQDKPFFLQLWVMFFMALQTLKSNGSSMLAWQLKLLFDHVLYRSSNPGNLVTAELAHTVKAKVDTIFDGFEQDVTPLLQKYYSRSALGKDTLVDKLTLSLILYDLPTQALTSELEYVPKDPLMLYKDLSSQHVPLPACVKLWQILKSIHL